MGVMDIYWYGQACFKLKGKSASVVLDPFTPDYVGLKFPKDLEANVVLQSHEHQDHSNVTSVGGNPMVFTGPGEYEVKGIAVTGISSDHDNSGGSERGRNIIFNVSIDGLNIVHLGDLGQIKLTESQVAEIGQVDILLLPVGGIFTIDSKQAAGIVAQLEPKIVIPMHYFVEGLKFQLDPAENFLKEMGAEGVQSVPKLSITKDKLPEETEIVVLNKG